MDAPQTSKPKTRPARPAALVNPDRPHEKAFAFSFSSGRHPIMRATFEALERILSRTLYRPFMRFLPPTLSHVAAPVANLPAALHGLRLVHLSDIHHSQIVPLRIIEQAVALANEQNPQVAFLTGDFVTNDASYAAACARALGRLRAPLGVYAVLGNHDYWTDPTGVANHLRDSGIGVLINEARQLSQHLWTAGLDDGWSGRPDVTAALAAVPQGATTILMAHEPDLADLPRDKPVALQLSGHSHGGQVRLPFTNRPVLPFLAWKYYVGLQRVGETLVYTNRGLGTMQPPFIFTCRPEVAVLTLTTA